MLEDSITQVYRRRLQTRLLAGALGAVMATAGCADSDALEQPAPSALRAESSSFDPSKESDPVWKECDAVYELRSHAEGAANAPFMVQPGGEFHPQVTFDTPWGDEPVQLIAFKNLTDNAKVLHHWILYNGQTMVTGWAPGRVDSPYPSDVGMELMPGKNGLRLDMHYYNTRGTKAEPDRSGLALCIVKGARRRKYTAAVHGGFSVFGEVMVPANSRDHAISKTCTVTNTEPVTILRVTPHAHQLAKHMKLAVKRAGTGKEEVVHEGSFYFEEQAGYDLRPGFELREGDVVTATCTYDNPTNKNVSWGESTDQEMCFLWSVYYPKGALKCGPPLSRPAPAAPAAPTTN